MIKKILNTLGTKIIIAIINLLIAIVISRILGAVGKGEQGLIITTITLILLFCNLFGGATIIYLIPRTKLQYVLFPSYLWSLLICIAFYYVVRIFQIVDNHYAIHVSALALIASFTSVHTSLLIARERIIHSNSVMLVQSVFCIACLIILFMVLNNQSLQSYILALYISYLTSLILSFLIVLRYFTNLLSGNLNEYWKTIYQLIKFGLYNQLGVITQMLSFRLSYYILDKYIDTQSVGVYSNSIALIESIWLISRSIALVQYSRIVNSKNIDYINKLTLSLFKISFLISLLSLIPFVIIPTSVFTYIFGAEFYDIKNIIYILMPGVLFFSSFLIISHFFSGTGKFEINLYGALIGLAFTLVLAFILIPKYSYWGAAITASISYIASSAFIILYYLKKSGFGIKELFIRRNDLKLFKSEIRNYFSK